MNTSIKIVLLGSLYTFLTVARVHAIRDGLLLREDGIIYFTAAEKSKIKAFFDADSTERQKKLEDAQTLLKKLTDEQTAAQEKKDTKKVTSIDKQIRALNTNIKNYTDRINTNTRLADDMIKTGKYSSKEVIVHIKTLGKTAQDIIQASGIRGKFLAEERFATPSLEAILLRIDALNSKNPPADIEQAFRKYTNMNQNLTPSKKFIFICDTIDELYEAYKRNSKMTNEELEKLIHISPKPLLKDAIDIIEAWLIKFEATFKDDERATKRMQKARDTIAEIKKKANI